MSREERNQINALAGRQPHTPNPRRRELRHIVRFLNETGHFRVTPDESKLTRKEVEAQVHGIHGLEKLGIVERSEKFD